MWNDREIQKPNDTSPEVRQLYDQFGLHSYMGVLCGWDWAIKYQNFQPTYQIELVREGSKQTIHSNNAEALNKVMKIYRR
jgi:hypothetical protein